MTEDQQPMMWSRQCVDPDSSGRNGSINCVSKQLKLLEELSVQSTTESSGSGDGIRMQLTLVSNKCAFAAANAA